jgi:thiosulfate dehydrogenase
MGNLPLVGPSQRSNESEIEGRMTKLILGILVGVLLVPLVLYAYLSSGYAPAAATDSPLPLETFIAGAALARRIQKEAPTRDVSGMPAADLVAGAQAYHKNCAMCHGLPNQPAPAIAGTIFPPAPELFSQKGMVTDDPAGETYWKVKNGIRLTAMPSFKNILSDDQIWQVTAVVARADKLPPEAQDALKPVAPPDTPVPATTAPAKPKSPAQR